MKILLPIVIFFLFATFPGKGGLEGDQRVISGMQNRSDNWGFLVPFILGNWPEFFGYWRFTLVVCQLCIFWVGLWLLLSETWKQEKSIRITISVLTLFASTFVSQLWRDATLLALATFGIGLLSKSIRSVRISKFILLFSSVFILHIAAMFKVLYGAVLGLFFIWMLIQSGVKQKRKLIYAVTISFSLTFTPYLFDKQLTSFANMQKVFPEQQPIIFDLASSYCWGTSKGLTLDAAKGIELVKSPDIPIESVCASLKPNRWDNLHSSENVWKFSSPISRITGNNEELIRELRARWLTMILNNPIDWIQVRLMFLGWTLTLSNSFIPQDNSSTWDGVLGKVNEESWEMIFRFSSILDKFRISSILFAFLVLVYVAINHSYPSNPNKTRFFVSRLDQLLGGLVLVVTTVLTLVGFVASNGRYVLPYVVLFHIFFLRARRRVVQSV